MKADSQVHSRTASTAAGNARTESAPVGSEATLTNLAPRLLLVGSSEQAESAQHLVDASVGEQGQVGLSPAQATVMEVGQNVPAADVLAAFGFENEQREARGLPPLQVEDLR